MSINLKNKDKYQKSLWFKVQMRLTQKVRKNVVKALLGNFRFYIWFEQDNACSCEMQQILDERVSFRPDEAKQAIIAVVPSPLSLSIKPGDHLFWGGLTMLLGDITIIQKLDTENLNNLYDPF